MTTKRKHSAEFKAQMVLLLISEKKSIAQLCKEYRLKDSLLSRWKKEFLQKSPTLFESAQALQSAESQHIEKLERLVGQLTLELAILKKASLLLNSL